MGAKTECVIAHIKGVCRGGLCSSLSFISSRLSDKVAMKPMIIPIVWIKGDIV